MKKKYVLNGILSEKSSPKPPNNRTSQPPNHESLERFSTGFIGHIPIIWIEPKVRNQSNRLAILLNGFTRGKEELQPQLTELADKGFVAMSFDTWQHGSRGTESEKEIFSRVFSNFRKDMWAIIGQSVLDTFKVIDWAISNLCVSDDIYMGGISMGGDIAVAAAGFDHRIKCVSAIIATPDWLRPGMRGYSSNSLVQQGEADSYSTFFYNLFDPYKNLQSFSHQPAITFECGELDTHVPPHSALKFQQALKDIFNTDQNLVRVNLHSNIGHEVTKEMWCNSVEWFLNHS